MFQKNIGTKYVETKLYKKMDNYKIPSVQDGSYDYIIAGAGCAGLSLLHLILQSPVLSEKKILVIDTSFNKTNDRTWCFWETDSGTYEPLVCKSWNRISIHNQGFNRILDTDPFTYKMIEGIDFYNHIIQSAREKSNIDWQEAVVEKIESKGEMGVVKWNGNKAMAPFVFSSILPFHMNDLRSASKYSEDNVRVKSTPFLWQHFKGRVVQFDQPIFNTSVARLMDFNVPQYDATAFMYLLPIDEKKALIEYTLFSTEMISAEQYDEAINDYLATHYPSLKYSTLHEEIGVIPMTQQHFGNARKPIYLIGALGSAIKSSTGYAFQFIQQQAKKIIIQLENNQPIDTRIHHTRHQFYDAVLLYILQHKKMEGKEIFSSIFKKNKVSTVFKFLSNTSTFIEDISIMRSLPTNIFLPAAIQVLLRR